MGVAPSDPRVHRRFVHVRGLGSISQLLSAAAVIGAVKLTMLWAQVHEPYPQDVSFDHRAAARATFPVTTGKARGRSAKDMQRAQRAAACGRNELTTKDRSDCVRGAISMQACAATAQRVSHY
jgi:hypothetical protein